MGIWAILPTLKAWSNWGRAGIHLRLKHLFFKKKQKTRQINVFEQIPQYGQSILKVLWSEVWKVRFQLMQILGRLDMCFDAAIVCICHQVFTFTYSHWLWPTILWYKYIFFIFQKLPSSGALASGGAKSIKSLDKILVKSSINRRMSRNCSSSDSFSIVLFP